MTNLQSGGEKDIIEHYARAAVRLEIIGNLGKLASGYFTTIEITQVEMSDAISSPDTPNFPGDKLSVEETLNIIANLLEQTPEEELTNQIEELEFSGGNEDYAHYEQERLQAAKQALNDYNDVKLFLDTGMNQDEAINEVLKLRQPDIDFQAIDWRASFKAAKQVGMSVPDTLEEWVRDRLNKY